MKNKTLFGLSTLILLGQTTPSVAYSYYKCAGNKITWSSRSAQIRGDATSFAPGSTYGTALTDAISQWNDNPSRFQFSVTLGDTSVGLFNLQNEVWGTDSEYWLDGAPAICYHWNHCANLAEADILFDSERDWTTSRTATRLHAYGGSERSFQTTALHELGHALGLAHENTTYNMMGSDQRSLNANGAKVNHYVGEDACNGAVFLYDLDSTEREDVSVTHWKYKGKSGEYSSHMRGKIYKTDETATTRRSGTSDDPVYEVTMGHSVLLELTYENSGANTQSVKVNYYLSGDKEIKTADTQLDTRTIGLGRNTAYTYRQTLVIPTGLTRGNTYYLGAIVDPDDTIAEVREDNNATYVGIYIK